MSPLPAEVEEAPAPRKRTARTGVKALLPASPLAKLKFWGEIITVVSLVGGGVLWLILPRINAHADGRTIAIVEKADAPIAPALKAATDAADKAAGEAASANALAQSQAELLGGLACLQAGGFVVADECAFRATRNSLATTLQLKNPKGLLVQMAVRR